MFKNLLTNSKNINIILIDLKLFCFLSGGFIMVFEKIAGMLAEQLGADENDMTMDTNIAKDLGADSLDVVELLMAIDDEFGIEIPDDEIENIKTIGDLVEYIQNNQ